MLMANIPGILLDPSLTGMHCSSIQNVKPSWGRIIFSPSLQYAYICSIHSYIEGFVKQLEEYLQRYGEEGKTELNTVCTNHSITLEASNIDRATSCDVKDKIFVFFTARKGLESTHSVPQYTMSQMPLTLPLCQQVITHR
jgi:hypothetical protein